MPGGMQPMYTGSQTNMWQGSMGGQGGFDGQGGGQGQGMGGQGQEGQSPSDSWSTASAVPATLNVEDWYVFLQGRWEAAIMGNLPYNRTL